MSGGRREERTLQSEEATGEISDGSGQSGTSGPTCGHGAHQHGVELDDGAEYVFGVGRAGQVLAVALEDEALVLFLEQHQDVLQQQCVELWMDGRRIKSLSNRLPSNAQL